MTRKSKNVEIVLVRYSSNYILICKHFYFIRPLFAKPNPPSVSHREIYLKFSKPYTKFELLHEDWLGWQEAFRIWGCTQFFQPLPQNGRISVLKRPFSMKPSYTSLWTRLRIYGVEIKSSHNGSLYLERHSNLRLDRQFVT